MRHIPARIKFKCDFVILQVAVCNLGSIALNMFVKPDKTFDIPKLKEVTKVLTRNLNKIIEINYYPVPEVRFLMLYYDEFHHLKVYFFLGQTFEFSSPSNWNWSSRLGGCFYSDALSI